MFRGFKKFKNDKLETGEGSVNISGATLDAGMYIYMLLVDSKDLQPSAAAFQRFFMPAPANLPYANRTFPQFFANCL